MTKNNRSFSLRFQPSGLNSVFSSQRLSFPDYVSSTRDMIEKTRLDLDGENSEKIIDANSPFEWQPPLELAKNPATGKIRNGILLIHGLFDSPYQLQSIADHFIAQNFYVRAILLPGHGSVPGDLIDMKYDEWLKATEYGINSFKDVVDHLYVCGFSTGALLALLKSYEHKLDGLILLSPAIKLQTQFVIASSLNMLIPRIISGIKWHIKADDTDYAKYQSFTYNPPHQVYLMTKLLQQKYKTQEIKTPLFIACSNNDEVLSTKATLNFFSSLKNPINRLLLYTNQPINFNDPRILENKGSFPEEKIISFSHICLPVAPTHPHYGKDGDFQGIEQYLTLLKVRAKKQKLDPKMLGQVYGAISRETLLKYNIRRLSYNPDFENLMKKVDQFIAATQRKNP